MSERYKKTLIEPKVRLLLSIYLRGYPQKSTWTRKLKSELDYDKSNLSNHLKELLHDKLIESKNPNGIDAPYKITRQGKKFLKPIIFSYQIGLFILIWSASWSLIFYLLYSSQPLMLALTFMIFILISFVGIAIILILQPYVLLKAGKISY
jgi:hypothetical protein